MPLKVREKLQKREKRPDLVVDVSSFTGDAGDTLKFREPGVSELIPNSRRLHKLHIDFARFSPETIQLCCLLSSCYIPDGEGDGLSPKEAAELAAENPEFFMFLAGEFGRAFPLDLHAETESLKND